MLPCDVGFWIFDLIDDQKKEAAAREAASEVTGQATEHIQPGIVVVDHTGE